MSSWKTYAKAARNTARKQAPDLARQAEDSARRGTETAGRYARAAGKAASEGTRESREKFAADSAETRARLRKDGDRVKKEAPLYGKVAWRRVKDAHIGTRLLHALRDALLMGGSIAVIWAVVSATGIKIPFAAVLVVILVLMVVRFGWALFGQGGWLEDEDEDEENDDGEGADDPADREFVPRDAHTDEAHTDQEEPARTTTPTSAQVSRPRDRDEVRARARERDEARPRGRER